MKITEQILPQSAAFNGSSICAFFALIFAFTPFAGQGAESAGLAVFCAGASALFAIAGAPHLHVGSFKSHLPLWLFAGFTALAGLSVALSAAPFVSYIYFCAYGLFPLLCLAGLLWPKRVWKPLILAIFIVLSLLAAFSVYTLFFWPDITFYGYATWPLANPNSLGAVLNFGFFACIGIILRAPSRLYSNGAMVVLAVFIMALMATGSRGAFIAALAVLPLLFILGRTFARAHLRCLIGAIALAALVYTGLSLISPHEPGDSYVEAVRFDSMETVHYNGERVAMWASALRIGLSHVWHGTGIGTFFLYYPPERGETSTAGLMAHGDPLQFFAEMGVFAPILFYALLLAVAFTSWRAVKGLAVDDPQRLHILLPFCAMAAITLQSHVSYNFYVMPVLCLMGLALSLWWAAVQEARGAAALPPHREILRYALALPIVAMLGIFGPFQASEIAMGRAAQSFARGDMDSYYAHINRAGQLSGRRNARALVEAAQVPLGILQLNAPFMAEDERAALYQQAQGLLDEAAAQNPRIATIPFYQAELARYVAPYIEAVKEADEAAYLEQALALDPLYVPARIQLANIYTRRGEDEAAYALMKDGLKWPYKAQLSMPYYRQLTIMAQAQNDMPTLGIVAQKNYQAEREMAKFKSQSKPE